MNFRKEDMIMLKTVKRNIIENLPGEEWKIIEDFPLYSVSSKGRVKKNECERFVRLGGFAAGKGAVVYYPEKLLTPSLKSNGYYSVCLQKDRKAYTRSVHRLVAEAFIENPLNLPHVNHKNENKLDNRRENLEWASAEENANYGTRTERMRKAMTGQKRQPLTDDHKKKIAESCKGINGKQVYCDGHVFRSAREAAEKYNVVPATMRNWLNGYSPIPPKFKDMGLRYMN